MYICVCIYIYIINVHSTRYAWEDYPMRSVHRHKKLAMRCIGLKSVNRLQVGLYIVMHRF